MNKYIAFLILLSATVLALRVRRPKPPVISEGPKTDNCPTCHCLSCRFPEYRPKEIVDSNDSFTKTNEKEE